MSDNWVVVVASLILISGCGGSEFSLIDVPIEPDSGAADGWSCEPPECGLPRFDAHVADVARGDDAVEGGAVDSAPGVDAGIEGDDASSDAEGDSSLLDSTADATAVDAPVDAGVDAACTLAPTFNCGAGSTATPPLQFCWFQSNDGSYGSEATPAACASGCSVYTCGCILAAWTGCIVKGCDDSMGQVTVTCR